MLLGQIYTNKIEDEKFYEKLITEEDFKGRSVLKIIAEKKFELLMDENDPKAENIMMGIWQGKEANRCDGIISGYSSLTHILQSTAKKIQGAKQTDGTRKWHQFSKYSLEDFFFFNIVSNYFKTNFQVDYMIQYKYRSKSVAYFFYKEICSSILMVIIF
jgi:hypothetical protein